MHRTEREWTKRELATLRSMKAQGLGQAAIRERLGRSTQAIHSMWMKICEAEGNRRDGEDIRADTTTTGRLARSVPCPEPIQLD